MISKDSFGNLFVGTENNRLTKYTDCLSISDQGNTIIVESKDISDFMAALMLLYPTELERLINLARLPAE